ncbi:MAG: PAS domain S-box protein [Actinobacteria bacterium]|nr:MAG: PAS domain S-box protein [Actinomycetota bacterium]
MKFSLRLWQTLLFITVIVVAMLTLSYTLMSSTRRSVTEASKEQIAKEMSNVVVRVGAQGPFGANKAAIDRELEQFSRVFRADIWLFDETGEKVFAREGNTRPGSSLERLVERSIREQDYATVLVPGREGEILAAQPILERGRVQAVIAIGENGADAREILGEAERQIAIAFWVALVVSGLLGAVFSEVIARQVRKLSEGALSIAKGNFDLRLKGMFPDEVGELASSFNLMAERLGHAFESLSEQQREIATVVETMAEGLIAVDESYHIRLINPAAARLLGVSSEEAKGRTVKEGIAEPELEEPIGAALSGRQVSETYEHDGKVLLLHASPIRSGQGKPVGVVLILRDVTEQKRMEQAQRDFISHASHELRTPISSLRGFIELLQGGAKQDAKVRDRFLATMETEVDRLQRLIEDLFTLAQLDAGRLDLKPTVSAVADIIGEVIDLVGPFAASSDLALTAEVEPDLPNVVCDRDRIIQVLLCFIDNALKHSPSGNSVTVFAAGDNGAVRIGVCDSGPGIPPNDVPRIFERFYRAKEAGDKRGAGLGLSIAKEIVEAHESAIDVVSSPNGTTFSFHLKKA